jgi:hypothetical protein
MLTEDAVRRRRDVYVDEVDAFLDRATEEGLLRPGLPGRWAAAVLPELVNLVNREQPGLSPGQAADVVVETLLQGVGSASR